VERRTTYLLGAGVAAGLLAWWFLGDDEPGGVMGDLRAVFLDAVNGITQGRRLTRAPYDHTTGIVPGDPGALAAEAGATLDEYALARNISSEHGNSSAAVQALVAHATVNKATGEGRSVAQLLLRANNPDHAGRFGTQKDLEKLVTTSDGSQVHPSDRYASTAQDPYEGHLAVARGVLSGAIPDLTGGADQYDDRSGLRDPDALAAKREAAGKERVPGLEEIIGDDLEFWRATS
jgi:hypothetical protein